MKHNFKRNWKVEKERIMSLTYLNICVENHRQTYGKFCWKLSDAVVQYEEITASKYAKMQVVYLSHLDACNKEFELLEKKFEGMTEPRQLQYLFLKKEFKDNMASIEKEVERLKKLYGPFHREPASASG